MCDADPFSLNCEKLLNPYRFPLYGSILVPRMGGYRSDRTPIVLQYIIVQSGGFWRARPTLVLAIGTSVYGFAHIYIWGSKFIITSACSFNYPSGLSSCYPFLSFLLPSGIAVFLLSGSVLASFPSPMLEVTDSQRSRIPDSLLKVVTFSTNSFRNFAKPGLGSHRPRLGRLFPILFPLTCWFPCFPSGLSSCYPFLSFLLPSFSRCFQTRVSPHVLNR